MRFETVFEKRVSRPIEDWLAELGLARYADAFAAAEIDLDILAELTDGDLLELGVLLGDRKRILKASTERRTAAPATERRHPTVIYCDLVDSTDLAVALEPRELRAVMAAYHARCADVVAAHGGEAQYLGGGVMVAFAGGPGDAHDAERAIRCALALLAAIGEHPFSGGTRLHTRIGIATGSATGPSTPSLAAQVQRFAEPESVLIAETTRRLLGDAFTFSSLGTRAVTGLAERVAVWRVEPVARVPDPPTTDSAAASATRAGVVGDAIGPQPPAERPLIERHFEDGGAPLAALQHWQSELERADRLHAPGLRLEALHASWTIAFSVSDLSFTLDTTAHGLALYDAASRNARRIPAGGHDASVCAAGYRALALILTGRIAEGRSWMRRTQTALESDDAATRCTGLLALAIARDLLGDYDIAIALASEARKLASKHRFATSRAHAALVCAAARIAMGDRIAGTRVLASLLDEPGLALPAGWQAYYLVRLALAATAAGDESAADARLVAAQKIASDRGGCVASAENERATAALLQLRGAPDALVEERLERAARLAGAQLAALLELRVASDALEFALSRSPCADATLAATRRIRILIENFDVAETTVDLRRARKLEERANRRF